MALGLVSIGNVSAHPPDAIAKLLAGILTSPSVRAKMFRLPYHTSGPLASTSPPGQVNMFV